jgi:hypothetical protein
VLVATSRTTFEPASLAVLTRRYGAGAPAVVELIRRTGGCTSPIRLEGESSRSRQDGSGPGPAVDESAGSRLRPRGLWQPTGVALSSLLGALSPRRLLPRRGWACGDEGKASRPRRLAPARLRDVHGTIVRGGPSPARRRRWRAPLPAQVNRRTCEHGIPMRCLERHAAGDPRIGQRSVRTATTTRPRLSGTRTLEPCGAGRSRTCPASSRPWADLASQRCEARSASPTRRSRNSRPVAPCTSMRSSGSTDPTVPTPRRGAERRRSV